MDLRQRKLNKSEWNSIEVSVSKQEIDILNMIIAGYHDVNIRINNNMSIFSFLKIDYSEKIEDFMFIKYMRERSDLIEKNLHKFDPNYQKMKIDNIVKLNSVDKIRLERFNEKALENRDIYEMILLNHIEKTLEHKKMKNIKAFHFHYYTLYNLMKNNVAKINRHIIELTNRILQQFEDEIDKSIIIENAVEFIEKNESLLKYGDLMLYEHQKEIFTLWWFSGFIRRQANWSSQKSRKIRKRNQRTT